MKISLRKIAFGGFLAVGILILPAMAQQPVAKSGLTQEQKFKINDKLNVLLANYSIFYQNARGLHWNIKGEHFFELHKQYELLYSDALLKTDQIAERILTLDGTPLIAYTDYANLSSIKASPVISDAREGVKLVLNSLQILMDLEKSIAKLATGLGDESTANLMVEYVASQEKASWMYKAFLAQQKK